MTTRHAHGRDSDPGPPRPPGFWTSRTGLTLLVIGGVAGLLLAWEHRAHILGDGALLLALLVCVGMHFFMHGGHGGRGGRDRGP